MAQPQTNIHIGGPGFYGVNTQDSPMSLDVNFASEATNCAIDKSGRIAARKGFVHKTTNPEILNGNPIKATQEFTGTEGTYILFACGNNTIYIQELAPTFALVPLAPPVGVTIVDDNWQIIPFNDQCFFVLVGTDTRNHWVPQLWYCGLWPSVVV